MRAFWNYPTTNQPEASPRKILRGAQKVLISYGVDREFQDPIFKRICNIPKQQIEVKRFKGLGEMNSEQLWETTLAPSKRVLLRVNLLEAAEAERMFSVLMGEDVERRRQFIEEHALEVKNLDV